MKSLANYRSLVGWMLNEYSETLTRQLVYRIIVEILKKIRDRSCAEEY